MHQPGLQLSQTSIEPTDALYRLTSTEKRLLVIMFKLCLMPLLNLRSLLISVHNACVLSETDHTAFNEMVHTTLQELFERNWEVENVNE